MGERALWEGLDRSGFPRPKAGTARPFVWAHRGASALEPENTMRSFQAAADLGADGIELDIQLTRDRVPVVIHDPMLWTDGTQLHLRHHADMAGLRPLWVRDLDWTDLQDVPVVWLGGRPERLTRFEQVIEATPEWLWLDVELKAGWTYDPALAAVFISCARRRSGRVLASSFDHLILRDVAAAEAGFPLLAILHARPVDLPGVLAAIPAAIVSIDRPFLTAEDVQHWTELGVEVNIGGAQLVEDLETVLGWPVAGVFLDDPRLALPARA